LSALACFAAIKAGLAAALFTRLADPPAPKIEVPRASRTMVAQLLAYLSVFAIFMASAAAIDLGLWDGNQPYWEGVYGVTIVADGLAAMLATMLAFAFGQRRAEAANAAVFD
jgi:hypothetical protein